MFPSAVLQPSFIPQQFPIFQQIPTFSMPQPISYMTPNQQPIQQRSKNVQVKGTWSLEEDEALRNAVSGSKPIFWDVVAKAVRGRTPKQCRERWMYRLQPELKKTPFEKWEDDLIFEQKKKIGNRWTQIAMQLPGRTSCSVKNRWYTVLRNKVHYNSNSREESSSSEHDAQIDSPPTTIEQSESLQKEVPMSMLSINMLLNH